MATQYFAGNSLGAFFRTTTAVIEGTSGGLFNSAWCRNYITGGAMATDYFAKRAPFLNGGSSITGTLYLRWDILNQNNQMELYFLSGGVNAYRITAAGSGIVQMQYWNTVAGTWNNWGSSITLTGVLLTYTLKLTLNSSYTIYANGSPVASSSTVPTNGVSSLDEFRFAGSLSRFSQIMCADYDLRDSHLLDVTLNGNSAANTGGTGTFSDVAEIILDETTAETVATVGNKMGQTHAAVTVPGGYAITGVVLNARGRFSGGVVSDGKLGFRSGGSNFSSGGLGYNGGYEPRSYIATTDPNTGLAWTQTTLNSAETYLEAA